MSVSHQSRLDAAVQELRNKELVCPRIRGVGLLECEVAAREGAAWGYPPEFWRRMVDLVVGPVRNVAQAYASFARDHREGTHLCPAFEDAVTCHRMLNAIETAAATGQRQTLG